MEGYSRSSHAKYRCEYHFASVPKYRYHVLLKEIKPQLRDIFTELCEWLDITITEGAIFNVFYRCFPMLPGLIFKNE